MWTSKDTFSDIPGRGGTTPTGRRRLNKPVRNRVKSILFFLLLIGFLHMATFPTVMLLFLQLCLLDGLIQSTGMRVNDLWGRGCGGMDSP